MNLNQTNDHQDELVGHAVEEYFEAVDRGERLQLDELVRRYPEIEEILRSVIPALAAADNSTGRSIHGDIHDRRELGDYRILRQLGRGGMGIVYEAEQISMGRRVALKVLPLAGLVDELKIRRFRNEVRAVAALDHPNIVSVFTVGEERGVHYYAMQLIRGRSLAEVISSLRKLNDEGEVLDGQSVSRTVCRDEYSGHFSYDSEVTKVSTAPAQQVPDATQDTVAEADNSTISASTPSEYFRSVAVLGIQAASALQHAHDQGVIHRDIKPANLLLDASSKLYVADFGLARVEADVGVTMTGDLIGTLRYMAPEQALAKRVVVDHRADIYSLGVTLYELLALQPAYPTGDRQQLMRQLAFEEPSPLRRVNPNIPQELEVIVQKAMSKAMDDRYASAQALADDLRCYLEHRPIKAKPPTLSQAIGKWTRRNPTIMWASVITMLLATVAFGVSALRVVAAKTETDNQLRVSTVTRLAAESRAQQQERPILAALLAVEAAEQSQRHDGTLLPTAHEALLNTSQHLEVGRTLVGHDVPISEMAMTSDWLITRGNHQVHLWNLGATRPEMASLSLTRTGEEITSMVTSEDGQWLATGGTKLQRWDLSVPNPQTSSVTLPDSAGASILGISRDGRWLVAQDPKGTIKRWDMTQHSNNPQVVWEEAKDMESYALSANGHWFAAKANNRVGVVDLRATTPSSPQFLPHIPNEAYKKICISPDGRQLIIGLDAKPMFRLWSLESELLAQTPRDVRMPSRMGLVLMRCSPDSRWLFARMGFGPRIHRWDLHDDDVESTHTLMRAHKNEVRALCLTRDGKRLLSGGLDGAARIWDLDKEGTPTLATVIRAHDEVHAAAIHPDGDWLATASGNGTARLWRLGDESASLLPFVLRSHPDDVFSASTTSSDGKWIATSVNPNAVQLWNTGDDGLTISSQILTGPEHSITSIVVSANDRWLVAGCRDSVAYAWDLTSADIASSILVLGKSIEPWSRPLETGLVTFGPNSRWLALASGDSTVRLWDVDSFDSQVSHRALTGHTGEIKSLIFGPDGAWLAAGVHKDIDGETIRVWDLTTQDPQPIHALKAGACLSMSLDNDGRWLATDGPGGSTLLWDMLADDPSAASRLIAPKRTVPWRIVLGGDARWLFTSRMDQSAQIWDLDQTRPKLFELQGQYGVQDASISPDGRWLAMGNRDGNVRLWDLAAPNPASTARVLRGHTEVVWSLGFSSDSRWLITDASDGTIRRWCLDTDWLLQYIREVAGRRLTAEEREVYGLPYAATVESSSTSATQ